MPKCCEGTAHSNQSRGKPKLWNAVLQQGCTTIAQARAVLGRLAKRLGNNDGSVSVRPPSAAIWIKLRGFPRWNQGLKRWTETLMEHTMNNIDDWIYAHGDRLFNWDSGRCRGICGGTAIVNTSGLACILRCCVLGPSNKGFAAAERMVSHQGRLRGEIYRASPYETLAGVKKTPGHGVFSRRITCLIHPHYTPSFQRRV
jgi:hypothetical protein